MTPLTEDTMTTEHDQPITTARPSTLPGQFQPGGKRPLMAMMEVTQRCNMRCPVCFADASTAKTPDVPLATIAGYLDQLLEVTRSPIPLQISGGEPSMRDDLEDIIALAKDKGFSNIELITNGIRISAQPHYLERLKNSGLTAVYLQFDGLKKETTEKIRGQDLSEVRIRAIEAIRQIGLCCTLAVVVARGVNDQELGDIFRFALQNLDVVRAINFQSAARLDGRFDLEGEDPGYHMPELLSLIEAQTGIAADTFYSGHLGHPGCNAMSPVFVVGDRLEPLFGYLTEEDLNGYMGSARRELILATFAGKKEFFYHHLCNPKSWRLIAKAAPIFGTNPINILRSNHLLLFAKTFMEKEGLEQSRLDACCYCVTGKGGVFSFCAYNNLYRFS